MRPSRAFTIVELLVAIAIIGVLAALLLPAVQAAREASRRAKCQNNLKQISLAVFNYANAHNGHLPALDRGGIRPESGGRINPGFSWSATVLPYLEEQKLFEQLHFDQDPGDPENQAAVKTILPVYLCPSTPGSQGLCTYFRIPVGSNDYLAVPYVESTDRPATSTFDSNDWSGFLIFRGYGAWFEESWDYGQSAKLTQVTDGLSKTVLIVERGSDLPYSTAVPGNFHCDSFGPDSHSGPVAWRATANWPTRPQGFISTCDGSTSYPQGDLYHPGGANTVMCDGSVHFLSAEQDNGIIWALVTRAGHDVIGPDW